MPHRHVPAAVYVEGVSGGVHQQMLRIQIFAAFGYDGEMAPYGNGKVLEDNVPAPDQSKAFVAEPFALMAPCLSVRGLRRIPALQDILQNAAFGVEAPSGKQPLTVDHDVFQIGPVHKTVGKVRMAVILYSHIGIGLRLVIITALPGLFFIGTADVCLCGGDDGAVFQIKVHIAGQPDGIGVKGSRGEYHGASVKGGGLNGAVDSAGVVRGGGLRGCPEVRYRKNGIF